MMEKIIMSENNLKRVNGVLLLVIIAIGGFSFWQIYIRTNAINEQNQLLTQYRMDNQTLENDVEMYLDFIQDLETRIAPDDVMVQNQESGILSLPITHLLVEKKNYGS